MYGYAFTLRGRVLRFYRLLCPFTLTFSLSPLDSLLLHSCLLGHCNKYDSRTLYTYQIDSAESAHIIFFSVYLISLKKSVQKPITKKKCNLSKAENHINLILDCHGSIAMLYALVYLCTVIRLLRDT